jgi:hypothetical protein
VTTADPALRIGKHQIPVVLPLLSDARLHTAGVVMTIHVLGQVALDFSVSVPQIASAILTAAAIEVAISFHRTGAIVWPASAMLTGSGVGLIMRAIGTEPGDHWTWHRWYLFAAVAGGSLLTKYAIRWHGTHLFNPSNLGLVAAFLVLGSERIEPLPFRWDDFGPPMFTAYTVIIAGGVLITLRLRLLEMAAACWVVLVAGLGVQAGAGHCVNVPWSDVASCDADLWWVITTSPEVLVFLFFMLTDPRTVPAGRGQRVMFAVAVGALAAALISPQRTEFGAKVALLGALTLATAARPIVVAVSTRAAQPFARARPDTAGVIVGACVPVLLVVWVGMIVAASSGARTAPLAPVSAAALPPLDTIEWIEPAHLPDVSVDDRAMSFEPTLGSARARQTLVVGLMRALAGEAQAARGRHPDLLRAVDHGRRLSDQRDLIVAAAGSAVEVTEYTFDSARLTVAHPPGQGGALLAVEAIGTSTTELCDQDGEVLDVAEPEPFHQIFAIRMARDGRLLIADVLQPGSR